MTAPLLPRAALLLATRSKLRDDVAETAKYLDCGWPELEQLYRRWNERSLVELKVVEIELHAMGITR